MINCLVFEACYFIKKISVIDYPSHGIHVSMDSSANILQGLCGGVRYTRIKYMYTHLSHDEAIHQGCWRAVSCLMHCALTANLVNNFQ